MWQRIRSLIIKELLAVLRDPRGRYILIVPPIVQMLVFSVAATQEVKNVHMAVLNEDYGTAGRDLDRAVRGLDQLRGDPLPPRRGRHRPGHRLAERAHGPAPRPGLLAEARRRESRPRSSSSSTAGGRTRPRSSPAMRRPSSTRSTASSPPRAAPRRRRASSPHGSGSTRTWRPPGTPCPRLVAILTTLMGLVVTSLTVARERELGTFEQLLVSPLEPIEIVIGKTVPSLIIGLAEGTVMLLVGIFVFRVPFQGSCRAALHGDDGLPRRGDRRRPVHLVAGHDSAAGASWARSCSWCRRSCCPASPRPIENMPDWLQTLTLANPLRYYMAIIKGVFLKGMPAAMVLRITLAAGRDRAGDPLGGNLAVPPSGRMRQERDLPRHAVPIRCRY